MVGWLINAIKSGEEEAERILVTEDKQSAIM